MWNLWLQNKSCSIKIINKADRILNWVPMKTILCGLLCRFLSSDRAWLDTAMESNQELRAHPGRRAGSPIQFHPKRFLFALCFFVSFFSNTAKLTWLRHKTDRRFLIYETEAGRLKLGKSKKNKHQRLSTTQKGLKQSTRWSYVGDKLLVDTII